MPGAFALVVAMSCVLPGCTEQRTPTPAAPPAASVEAPPVSPKAPPVDLDKLDALLEKGDLAFKDNRLLTPIDNCAYDYYREALVVAPNHPAALHGIERIAERYVAMAEQAAGKGQYAQAQSLLERARIVDPDLDSIRIAEQQIGLRAAAKKQRTAIDASQLSAHASELSDRLKTLGAQAKAQDAWVVIRAPTDAAGRWIYQQMADAPGDRRIRAELTLGSPPSVELLDLAAASAKQGDYR